MGNCLLREEKFVKVMKVDGKILEYQTPLKVHQVLLEFTGHSISDTLPVQRHLSPDTDMLRGGLYYLLPPPLPSKDAANNTKKPSNDDEEFKQGSGVVRIKIVITKQELKEMLDKDGLLSVDSIVSQLQDQQRKDVGDANGDDDRNCSGWKPVLQSIPE